MTIKYRLLIAGMTDTGLVRAHNEDCLDWDADLGVALIADGMGGHNAGEVASRLAIETMMGLLHKNSGNVDERRLQEIVTEVNRAIYDQARAQAGCDRMGTTLVMLCLYMDRLFITHIGDSRAYRLRDGELLRLTDDHSLVRQLLDDGAISKDEARASRYKNVITRALGVRDDCDAEIAEFDVVADDIYLLCSDGLTDMVADNEIRDLLVDEDRPDDAVTALMTRAREAGGRDNISVIVAAVTVDGDVAV
jgi:PPM family protein phosphatase